MVTRSELEQMAMQKMAQEEVKTFQSVGNPTRAELEALAMQKMAQEESLQGGQVPTNPNKEASLGFATRAQYALEPIESNRRALLVKEFGPQNVQYDPEGNVYVNQGRGFEPVNVKGFSVADVADVAGSLPEMAGTAIGAVLGSPASLPGAIGLGALGGAVGSGVRQALSAAVGTPQVAGLGERAAETGLSAAVGGAVPVGGAALKAVSPYAKKAGGAVLGAIGKGASKIPGAETTKTITQATSNVIKDMKDSLITKVAPDAAEYFAIAEKHGINKELLPEAVEFGKLSSVSRASRVAAESGGEERLVRFNQAHQEVGQAIDNVISTLAPERPVGTVEAGQFLVDSVDEAVKGFFGNIGETYSEMVKNAPGVKLSKASQDAIKSKLEGIRTFAIGRVKRGIGSQKQEAASLLEAVDALKKNNGSLKQVTEALQNIGEEAFKKGPTQNRLPIDRKRLQGLYHDIHKEVVGTVREVYGDDVAENLLRNNKMITDFLGQNSVLSKTIGREGVAPENVFKSLVERGDTKKIEALSSVIGPEKMQQIRGTFLDSLVKRNADGLVMFKSTINNLDKNKAVLSKLFNPEEMSQIGELLKLGNRMGEPIMSSSGTGASNAFLDIFKRAKGAAISEAGIELSKKRAREKFIRQSAAPVPETAFRRAFKSGAPSGAANVLTNQQQRNASFQMVEPGKR